MIQDQLRDTLDAIRVKLQAELDSHIAALGEQQAEAIKQARAGAEQDADRRWSARLESAQNEWAGRLKSELAAAAAEADTRLQAESARLQAESEELAARIRAEVAGERTRREEVEAEFLQWRDRADVAEQRRVAEAAERQRRETEREQHYRRELAELLAERQRREAAIQEERQKHQADIQAAREQRDAMVEAEREQRDAVIEEARREREAAVLAERREREDAFQQERQELEASFREERESREAVFSEERQEHEAKEAEARQRLEALQTELRRAAAAEQERQQRTEAEKAEQQRREAATREEHRRIVADVEAKLAASQETLAAERGRVTDLENEGKALREELTTVKAAFESFQQVEGQRVRELEDQIRSQRHQFDSTLETERKRTSDLTDALGRAQVSLAAERQSMAAAQKALATERLAIASEHEAVARARDALAAEREATARAAPLLGHERLPVADVTEARAAERQSQLAVLERLLNSTRAIALARSLSEALAALLAGAGAAAPRAALFVINANTLQGWKSSGFGNTALPASLAIEESGVLGEAVTSRQTVPATSESAPAFASLAQDRAGVAVPILVGGRTVAVLYADDGDSAESLAPSSWPEEIQVLGQHASVCLAHLTAVRSAQAARIERANATATATFVPDSPQGMPSEDSGARRYAKLLVSEIKLYNESAVRLGREKRDLMNRLRPEIDRARKLYEERVSPTVAARGSYFQQELVQTLADGDPALLGSSA
jgi:hypothetical protein